MLAVEGRNAKKMQNKGDGGSQSVQMWIAIFK